MKTNEVVNPKAEMLRESIARRNRSGYKTEDLAKIVEARETNNWTEFTNVSKLFEHLEKLEK